MAPAVELQENVKILDTKQGESIGWHRELKPYKETAIYRQPELISKIYTASECPKNTISILADGFPQALVVLLFDIAKELRTKEPS